MNESPLNFFVGGRETGAVVRLHPDDNIVVAVHHVARGEKLHPCEVVAQNDISRGHKAAIAPIRAGDNVIKYGQIIGAASRGIAAGEHVHLHNMAMSDFVCDYAFCSRAKSAPRESFSQESFQGYRRPDGRFGTRNYIGVITSVNCSATVARLIAREAERRGIAEKYPNVDGIVPIVHGAGCCIGAGDEAFYKLERAIWGHVVHPNFAAVMMVGLGCETNQIPRLLEKYGSPQKENFLHFNIQQKGGTRKAVAAGVEWLEETMEYADRQRRETAPVSELRVALQCGGSDGFSGITANPALGAAVDSLVVRGGCAALAETPEIYGAEHLLTARATSRETGEKLVALIKWWEKYAARHGGEMNNNPTPGNKAGGLTTILEKSLGAVAKGGSTNLADVYQYGERITSPGLVFVDSPGYDPVSITGQVASGCNLVCFTTGRGSCYGNKPSPTIKIASNTPMFNDMRGDMDINCGAIADGTDTVDGMGEIIFREMLEVASGKRTLSEQVGAGDLEFVPWQTYAQM